VLAVPEVAFVPVQSPLAVQLVAFVLLHVNVELPPLDTLVGETLSVSVGAAGGCCTVTVAVAEFDPPVPLQFKEKLEFAVSAPVLCEPLVALVPDQPPEAVHDVAFVADQVSVLALPLVTVVGFAVSVVTGALGGGSAPTCTLADPVVVPPRPAQLKLYVCDACNGPSDCEPLVVCRPFQPPDALHLSAAFDDHDSTVDPPADTLVGLTAIEMIGAFASTCCCCACANAAICVSSDVATRAARPSNVTSSALVSAALTAVRASAVAVEPSSTE